MTARLTLAGRTASTAAAKDARVASLLTGRSGREGPAPTRASVEDSSTRGGAANIASSARGETPAATHVSDRAVRSSILRAPARASKGNTSDWPVLSASATSSAKEPRGGPMVVRETGKAGEGPGGRGREDSTALTLFWRLLTNRSSQNEGTGASPTLAGS